jgi:hypothetical protein
MQELVECMKRLVQQGWRSKNGLIFEFVKQFLRERFSLLRSEQSEARMLRLYRLNKPVLCYLL